MSPTVPLQALCAAGRRSSLILRRDFEGPGKSPLIFRSDDAVRSPAFPVRPPVIGVSVRKCADPKCSDFDADLWPTPVRSLAVQRVSSGVDRVNWFLNFRLGGFGIRGSVSRS